MTAVPTVPDAAVCAVAVGDPGETWTNTLVVGGATMVVPIEMDPENDPLHDDEVRLWSVRGGYDRTLYVNDPAVDPDLDARLMHYRFDDVPRGVYRVAVCVAGEWHDLLHDIVVAGDGVYLGGKKLPTDRTSLAAAPPAAGDDHGDSAADEDSDGTDAPEPRTFDHLMPIADEADG